MAVAQGQLHQMWATAPETKNQLKNFSHCLHCLDLKLCLWRAGADAVTFPFFVFFNTLELHWHVYCMVRIPHALIKKHYHLLTSPLHQLQQDNRLAGCEETSRYSRVSSISPTQHPSSCLQTQHKWFSPRQLKRKASRLWSGNCLLSVRETCLAFSSPALHIYQGKLKETQEGVLLFNNPARF